MACAYHLCFHVHQSRQSLGSQTLPLPQEISIANENHQSEASINPSSLNETYEKENDQSAGNQEVFNVINTTKSKPEEVDAAKLKILSRDQWRTGEKGLLCKVEDCEKRQQSGKDNMCCRHYTLFKKAGVDSSNLTTTETESKTNCEQVEFAEPKVERIRNQAKKKRAPRELEDYLLSPAKNTTSQRKIRPKRGID